MSSKSKFNKKLIDKGKKVIPGGSLLFSKKNEVFIPDKWPTYYYKAKDACVWDMNKTKFLDI